MPVDVRFVIMLKENFHTGNSEKSRRRWFSDDYFDLIVWAAPDGSPTGFQLCYDKYKKERALTWTTGNGYSHERVDDGESNPSKNLTPILVPNGVCPTQHILERFLERSTELDSRLRSFIVDKLREYHLATSMR